MHCLFLDLASHDGCLACVTEGWVLASENVDHRIGDHELIPLFERTLDTAGWKPQDLTHVACIIGPGGFMSLRVAAAFANTLMHELKIPGAGVHLSEVYAARARPHPSLDSARDTLSHREKGQGETSFLWLHSTKKQELFVRGFGAFAVLWPEPAHVTTGAFLERLPQGAAWTGELIPEHVALFQKKHLQPVSVLPLPEILPVLLAHQKFSQKLLEPWYGRSW